MGEERGRGASECLLIQIEKTILTSSLTLEEKSLGERYPIARIKDFFSPDTLGGKTSFGRNALARKLDELCKSAKVLVDWISILIFLAISLAVMEALLICS